MYFHLARHWVFNEASCPQTWAESGGRRDKKGEREGERERKGEKKGQVCISNDKQFHSEIEKEKDGVTGRLDIL